MIDLNPRQHRARVNPDGNIILPQGEEGDVSFAAPERAAEESATELSPLWEIDDGTPVHPHLSTLRAWTRNAVTEGLRECEATAQAAPALLHEFENETTSFLRKMWRASLRPIRLSPRGSGRPRSRAALFVIDILRFGGTFTGIFALLFVAMNAQSFAAIAAAHVSALLDPPAIGASDARATTEGDIASAPMPRSSRRSILEFLPPVGPPENRLIVPKLRLNVPILQPSTASLLRQDWPQVERDIQQSLEGGVVHYPGTAVPGQAGNFFITGHSSYYLWAPGKFKSVFARLSELQPGDEYWVYYGGDKHRYVVRARKEVRPSDISVLDQPAGKRLSTLMTCTPVGTTLRRLVIQAEEVDPSTGIALKVGQREKPVATQRVPLEALPI